MNALMFPKAINIILDHTDPQNVIFVEIETNEGKSVNIGTRTDISPNLTALTITEEDIRGIKDGQE